MKSIKYLLVVLVAALTMVSSSKAVIYTLTTNFSKLTISLTVTTNAPYTYKKGVYTYKTITVKITNKDLLALFANWDGTIWPAGAQLVEGWDSPWNGDVLVVDKSGTNVLFDATEWNSPDQYFYIDFFDGEGAYSVTDNENDPGFYDLVWGNTGYFQLYDNVNFTYLSASGPCMENFSQKWDKNHVSTTWSDTETYSGSASAYNSSDEELNGNHYTYTSVDVDISAKGNGAGQNYLYELYEEP